MSAWEVLLRGEDPVRLPPLYLHWPMYGRGCTTEVECVGLSMCNACYVLAR